MSESLKISVTKEEQILEKPRTIVAAGFKDSNIDFLQYLREIGYVIECAQSKNGLVDYIRGNLPNVLLIDSDTVGKDAIKITEKLKSNPMTYTMPVIIAMGNRNWDTEIKVLDAGAEDFIEKPFPSQVLAARIHTSIKRNTRLQVSNPLTGLPGAIYIEEQATKRLANELPIALCYTDLDFFKAFNDKYSYGRGDNVLRILATILTEGVGMYGKKDDFVGHIGGDDFIMIVDHGCIDEVCNYVTTSFDALVPYQYDPDDMNNGYIMSTNRQNEETRFPIMTVSIGVVSNKYRQIESYLTMTELAAEMKEFTKSQVKTSTKPKSDYRVDQRVK